MRLLAQQLKNIIPNLSIAATGASLGCNGGPGEKRKFSSGDLFSSPSGISNEQGFAFRSASSRHSVVQQLRSKRRRNPEVWSTGIRLMSIFIVAGALAFLLVAFYPEWTRKKDLSTQLAHEKSTLSAEELLRKQRSREVDLLKNDTEYVEAIARDKIGVMKEGETIYRLDAPGSAPAAITAKPAKP